MPEMVEFYNTNTDFKLYCDRYALSHRMMVEDVFSHKLIEEVYIYYKSLND